MKDSPQKTDAIAEIIKEQTITDLDGNVLNSEEVAGLIVKYVQSGAMPVPVRRMRWADLTKQEKCVIE